jgi:ATP-dependent RNA helicase SUPV3L1/SUV3
MSNKIEKAQRQPKKQRREQLKKDVLFWLAAQPDQMARKAEFAKRSENYSDVQAIIDGDDFVIFDYKGEKWIHHKALHTQEFIEKLVENISSSVDDRWKDCQPLCGDVVRDGSRRAHTNRLYVTARTYTEEAAAKRLFVPTGVIRAAIKEKVFLSFVDPEGRIRIPAQAVEAAAYDEKVLEKIIQQAAIRSHPSTIAGGRPRTSARSRPTEEKFLVSKPTRKWEESKKLRQQLLDVFPTWETTSREEQHITLHLGPTNSGKTFQGLNHLVAAGSGWYLSPLRLLAHEVYDTLNKNGVPCNLLTGEESIEVAGATITASTIEMFSPARSGNCIIIDEAQMLSDTQRGWAWTRAIMETTSPQLHILGSPIAESLVKRLADELGFTLELESYQRLTPLEVNPRTWSLTNLPARTILVAFSRRMVLGLKSELEGKFNRSVSVVYGNLPPEVRLKQAERFANGETEICIATDAVGMGLNLPADNVCFYETSKFDGNGIRTLTANEIKQIGGRAGRFGLSKYGSVGALTKADLAIIRNAINSSIDDIEYAYVAPTPESIALLPGDLAEKLSRWVELNGIPDKWKQMLKPVDLSEQIALAKMLAPDDVKRIGEDMALELINAPCAKNTEDYWLRCAQAIIDREPMPTYAANPPQKIHSAKDLETVEYAIRCADIYLWLSQRMSFGEFAPEEEIVRSNRYQWSMDLDSALVRQIDTARRCGRCGRILPLNFRYNICNTCHRFERYNISY